MSEVLGPDFGNGAPLWHVKPRCGRPGAKEGRHTSLANQWRKHAACAQLITIKLTLYLSSLLGSPKPP